MLTNVQHRESVSENIRAAHLSRQPISATFDCFVCLASTNFVSRFGPERNCAQPIREWISTNTFILGYTSEICVQGSDTQRLMCGNSEAMRSWLVRLQDDVTADLVTTTYPQWRQRAATS
jgi:hypothetical protein